MKHDSPKFPIRKLLPLSGDLAQAISEFRHTQRIASETEATRHLIRLGLDAAAQRPQQETHQ